MELIERPNLDAVYYLNSISFETFRDDCIREAERNGEKTPPIKDIKTWHTILKQFCNTNVKTRGITKRIYSHSLGTPSGLGGRLFCSGSLQSIWSVYRGLLMRGLGTDLDMCNAHPTILSYICRIHDIPCPQLDHFIRNRDRCLAEFDSRTIGKKIYLSAVNSDKYSKSKNLPRNFKLFDDEMGWIQKQIIAIPEYQKIVQTVPDSRELNNFNGSAINRIMCYYENIILQHAIHVINGRGLEIAILMFDGLMLYGDHYDNSELLEDIESYVASKMPGLNMKWSYKPHDNTLQIPPDFDLESAKNSNIQTFEELVAEFELTHAKITKLGAFVSVMNDEIVVMTKQHLITSYEHRVYDKLNKDGVATPQNFIRAWLAYPSMRVCRDVGIYPKESLCPPDIFNTWSKFAMESVSEWEHREEALQDFLKHILILCNNQKDVADYFIKWIAHMIQFPEQKSVCPVLISEEGAGKGTIFKLLEKMFGEKKVFSTSDPKKHVWGDFNSQMANAFLVNLDELSKKDTIEAEGKIKALITEPTMMINTKGVRAYPIQSYHRFIVTTNKEEPVNTSNDDRRKFIIRSSDELIGDKAYFNQMNLYLNDVNVVKTCYEYFKSIPDIDKFNRLPLPVTEYHAELKSMNRDPIDRWIEDYAMENCDEEYIDLTAVQMLGEFQSWCQKNHVNYHVDTLKLSVRIARLNIDGVEGKRTKKGRFTRFIPSQIASHFGNGCLVNLEEWEEVNESGDR